MTVLADHNLEGQAISKAIAGQGAFSFHKPLMKHKLSNLRQH